jgi:Zn-dependent protease
VHAEELKRLAARAEQLARAGEFDGARLAWQESLALLPASSRQHEVISGRVTELDGRLAAAQPAAATPARDGPWWKQGLAAGVTLLLLLAGKLKFLLLGLTKAQTFVSMFAFFGVYWSTFGWPLALGLVLSIYVPHLVHVDRQHEMGHVAMLRRLKIDAGAPLFIPGVGALVMLKQRVGDPRVDAAIGLAGPVWGLGAGVAAYAVYAASDAAIWLAIAQLTGFINLFNLIPVWQLDGARGFHALSTAQRWAVIAAVALGLLVSGQKLLIIVGAVAVWHALRRPPGPGDRNALATFLVLVAALSWLASLRAV